MESRHVGASSKGVLIPVSETSDVFQSSVLAPLQSAYLYEESKQFFRYKSAVLVKNPHLEEKYNAFRAQRINAGYSEDDLKESYGFLLFEDGSKANALGETGVLTGNSTCTTLGDPSKGVYIPMYSDCLDLNPWYHGKSGYIVIIRLTKGKVKKVVENYTQNFTEPTVGFDCHVSEQWPSVSDKTSSFLAFERTQYYMYELLDGSSETARSPSAAFPSAVVSFSYKDTKATLLPQETSGVKELVCHYLPWRGQLQTGSQFYHVDLRSPAVASVPVKLPPVVKVDKVISMSVLRQLLPRAVFETCCAEEALHDGFYCSLCEFVPSEAEEGSSFAQLLAEIKEKDLALVFHLNDRGFLILLHSSQFLTYEDNDSTLSEVMPGLFVFPDSRVVRRDPKLGQRNLGMSLEILRLLPVLSFAEAEVEKTPMDSSRDFCEVLAQHMQSYATLINPGLPASPSRPTRELSIFPDQYDVGEAHKHLYSSPEWTNGTWQNFVSSLGKPESFQLPVLKVSEILAAGQEEQREDLDEDDVYICLSSPEAPTSPVGLDLEDQLSDQQPPVNVESSVDMSSPESQVAAACVPHSVVTDDLQAGDDTKDNPKTADLTELNGTDDVEAKSVLSSPTSDDLPAELIVSITSAEKSVTDENLRNISAMSTAKHNDFEFSGLSPISKLQKPEVNSVRHKTGKVKKGLNSSEVAKLTGDKQRQLRRRPSQVQKKVSKPVETRSLQVVLPGQVRLNCNTDEHTKDLDVPVLRNSLKTSWRKLHRRKRRFGKLSPRCKKVRSCVIGSANVEIKKPDEVQQSVESTTLMEDCPLRRKTERWDLKPVLSGCGRILVPFGFLDITDVVRSSKDLLQSTEEECLEPVVPKDLPDTAEMEEESSTTSGKVEADVMATNSLEDGDDLDNAPVSPEHVLKQPVAENGLVTLSPYLINHSPKNDETETVLLHAAEDNPIETLSPVKHLAKGEFLLSRLKSVLSRRKRKVDLEKKETENTHRDDEPHLKKANVDSDSETSKSEEPAPPNTDSSVIKDSNMRSVDLAFAYCLGLTPKENRQKIQNTEDQDDQQRKDSTENEEHISLDKQPKIMQRPPSIFQRRKRIKTLKRLQGISADNVKKKCTTFQVPPLSGSTGLLNHPQSVHDDGVKTLQPSVNQEDTCEHNQASDCLNRHRQKFRHSRAFAFKDGSVQVTRQWQENYDFSHDSRFTSDPKDKVIIRALHGPWDFSVQDTTEEVRLIFHMWIGLFYSRSTSRFFQIDPNFTQQFEESESLQKASKLVSGPARTEDGSNSSSALSSATSTPDPLVSEALDLSKKEGSLLEPESVVLDLSLRSSIVEPVSSELQVSRESSEQREHFEPLDNLTSAAEAQEEVTSKHCEKMETEFVKEGDVIRNVGESNETETPQKALCLGLNEVPSSKVDETHVPQPEETCVSVEPEAENDHVLHGCNEVTTVMTDSTENSDATKKSLDRKDEIDSVNSVTVKVNSNLEKSDFVNTDDCDKVKESCNTRNDPCSESNIDPDVMDTDDDAANKKSDVICQSDVANQKPLSSKETKASSPDHTDTDSLNGDSGCCTRLEESDGCLRNDELYEKETCVSSAEGDGDVEHQPSPKKTGGQIKEDCILESIDQVRPHEQPLSENSKNDCNGLCASPIPLKDGSPTLNSCYTPTQITPISKNSAAKENFDTVNINGQKPVLPFSDEDTCALDESPTAPCIPSEKDNIQTENRPKVLNLDSSFCSNDHKQETKPTEGEETTGQTSPQGPDQLQSSSSKCEVDTCEPDESFPGKTDLKANETNKDGDKSWIRTVIPFLGEDTPDTHVLQPQDKVEKSVEDQETIPFINGTDPVDKLSRDECSASHSCDEMAELSPRSTLLVVASETPTLEVFDKISGRRSPTPTMDEETYENISSSPISSTFTNSDDETCQNITPDRSNRCSSPVTNELPFEQKPQTSTVNDSGPDGGLYSDVKLRTLRVLQSINKYFSTGCDIEMPNQIKTDEMKISPDPTGISGNKRHISSDVTNQRSTNGKPPEMSSSNSQGLISKSPDNTLASSLKNKLEDVHNVKLHLKNKKSSISQQKFKRSNRQKTSVESNCRSYRCFSSAEGLQHKHKRTLQSSLNHKSRSHAQHSVVAAKRFKAEESPMHWLSKDTRAETTSQSKQVDTQIVENSSTFRLSKKTAKDFLKGTSEGLNIHHNGHEASAQTSWLTNGRYSKYNADEDNTVHFDPPHLYRGKTLPEFTLSPSPLSMSSFRATESYPEFVDEHQGFMRYSLNKTTEYPAEQKNQNDKSFRHHKDNGFCKGRQKDQGSIICTIFNTGEKDSYSVLDQLSQRCLPGDPTQASVERERLIFSEQMKDLLKKSTGGSIGQQNTCDSFTQSCTRPLIVNFSSLEEQEDSGKVLDMPLVRQKIMVDMSDRKGLADSTRGENMPHFLSQGTRNPVDPTRVSDLIAEGAMMYEAKMDGVCLVKKASSRTKRIQRGYSGTEPGNHFDFCDQMKKELDETFRRSLNAVVKKSSKTKYRFYLLVTSDDVFFKETKAHLEAEGHTAVQLSDSDLSPDEDSSSCLLVILRNEDIAEHICKIPHLLKLKMTPGVQFAGIDEPDDVVNLTHQELFTRAGFIIIDRAVLEALSLCHMKKISEVLQELNRKRKWKWMLHYRDSRRLKEDARLSEEANEKKLFLNWGQDAGILEVLPYHECDLMSKGQPDYLACLLRLQVQHISSRFPVFITDAATNGAFEDNGILTMTLNSFLTKSLPEIFTV